MVKITDLFGVCLVFIGVYVFLDALKSSGFQQLMGVIGSVGLITIELIYLISFWRKR